MIGRCVDVAPLLKWTEEQQHREILMSEVRTPDKQVMVNTDLVFLNSQIWSFLNLNLQTNSAAMVKFEAVEPLHGIEVWRRPVVPHLQ